MEHTFGEAGKGPAGQPAQGASPCELLREALADTASIQEDMMLRPHLDFRPRFDSIDQRLGAIGDPAVREAGLAYVNALRWQVHYVKTEDRLGIARNFSEGIMPTMARLGQICPDAGTLGAPGPGRGGRKRWFRVFR